MAGRTLIVSLKILWGAALVGLPGCQTAGSRPAAASADSANRVSSVPAGRPAAQDDYVSRQLDDMAREDAQVTRVRPPADGQRARSHAPAPFDDRPGPRRLDQSPVR